MGCILFSFFTSLVIFDWVTKIKFTMLSAAYFCTLLSILVLGSVTELCYLETVWVWIFLLLWLAFMLYCLESEQPLGLTFSSADIAPFWVLCVTTHKFGDVPTLADGKKLLVLVALGEFQGLFLLTLSGFLSTALYGFLPHIQLEVQGRASLGVQSFFFVLLSLFWHPTLQTLATVAA